MSVRYSSNTPRYMAIIINKRRIVYLDKKLSELLQKNGLSFGGIRKHIPKRGGVYLISLKCNNQREIPLYVGLSGNLLQRIYQNHLMGDLRASSFKRHLINSSECKNKDEAKEYIKSRCLVRWISIGDKKKRGALEGYFLAMIFPRFGYESEH